MDNHPGTLVEHLWQKGAIQPDSRKQVEVERPLPFIIIEHREAARRGRRTSNDMNHDVDAAKLLHHGVSDSSASLGSGDVSGHK